MGVSHKMSEDRPFLCGHENPFEGWAPFVRIVPLRIDSLVEVLAPFIKVVLRKCKGFINKGGMLVSIQPPILPHRPPRKDTCPVAPGLKPAHPANGPQHRGLASLFHKSHNDKSMKQSALDEKIISPPVPRWAGLETKSSLRRTVLLICPEKG
jgi:hypothetical protein